MPITPTFVSDGDSADLLGGIPFVAKEPALLEVKECARFFTNQAAWRATLEVRRSNEVARALYESFGFSVAGVRRGYYTNPPEDALILWREGLGPS